MTVLLFTVFVFWLQKDPAGTLIFGEFFSDLILRSAGVPCFVRGFLYFLVSTLHSFMRLSPFGNYYFQRHAVLSTTSSLIALESLRKMARRRHHERRACDKSAQKPSRHGLCTALRNDFHWKCLISTLAVHACVCYAVWCHINHQAYSGQVFLS